MKLQSTQRVYSYYAPSSVKFQQIICVSGKFGIVECIAVTVLSIIKSLDW